ncbi:autotransporter outer membrane beta-barrel domain-containing protein, partial [Neorhizobium sp. T786]|uniref:autotransporter outer membrane beta-barrel domain-containing protein n=1 Tax=Pseudorhizobium xiangyangii TaxID=2883104 RepID=UPI001D000CA0
MILFNHTSDAYVFDATLNGGADNAAGSGTGVVGSGLVDAIAGRTILNADHGDFTGVMQARDGGILQINGDVSGGIASVLAGGRLEGNGFVGNTVNAGTIAPGTSIGTLTVVGDYTGNGGLLETEAVLGADSSPADLLVVTGNTSGSTDVRVINLGGTGALTIADGIRIVDVGGTSGGAFSLLGDY